MFEFEVFVEDRDRQTFDKIIKSLKIEIINEDRPKRARVRGSWVTVQMSIPYDAYRLGRKFERDLNVNN